MRALPGRHRVRERENRRTSSRGRRYRFRCRVEALEPRVVLSVGGGSTAAGLLGEYYNNTDLAGTPEFTRSDVRIDFEWGGASTPGGSNDPGYSTIGTNDFSVRWTGQVVPRFSEDYTFSTITAGGVRFFIKPADSSTWTQLVDNWSGHESEATDSGQFTLTAGQTYDIKMEYYAAQTAPEAALKWASPSTPLEVIDPLGVSGINIIPYSLPPQTFADAMKQGRDEWQRTQGTGKVAMDADGWPRADARNTVWEGKYGPQMEGTYLLQFQGTATVTAWRTGLWQVGQETYTAVLPKGVGYDPATNTTTAKLVLDTPVHDIFKLSFTNTQRTSESPLNSGVTEIHLMRPTSVGAATSYPLGQVYCTDFIQSLQPYTVLRDGTSINGNMEGGWTSRLLPSYHTAVRRSSSMAWEDLVMLSNESGKDLYILIPMKASDNYITNLAKLIKYGSDGVNPYNAPQADPVYPGLNPNLRVYVEWSNEIWNWSFTQAQQGVQLAKDAVERDTPNGRIINYDGKAPNGNYQRWTALRTVQTSNIFRAVWGDAAMGNTVRVLLEYQYDNEQNTAKGELSFIDNYFNNADGQHVADPHPVSYYIWGGGGATYYRASNEQGLQTDVVPGNFSLESPGLEPGTVRLRPADADWNFTGDSGVVSDTQKVSPAAASTLGTLTTTLSTPAAAVGYSFTVESKNVAVYELGRYVAPGDTRTHRLHLIRADNRQEVATVVVDTSDGTVGEYVYGALATPVMLTAGKTYYLLSEETRGRDPFYDQDTMLTPAPDSGVEINGAMRATYNGRSDNTTFWTYTAGTAGNYAYGPVDIKIAPRGAGRFGFIPDAPDGSQVLFLTGGGAVSQTIDITVTGTYALQFEAAAMNNRENSVDFYIDGTRITPRTYDITSYFVSPTSFLPGRTWAHNYRRYQTYQTVPFEITTPGPHTIEIVGRGDAGKTLFLDNFQLSSLDAIFNSTIPAFHTATDYQDQLDSQAKYARSYGLHVVAYEGGWALGGNTDVLPLQNYAKYVDPRAAQANIDSIDAFTRSGGDLYIFGSYNQWLFSDSANSADYPLVQGVSARNQTLPVAADNGTQVPGTLDQSNLTWSLNDRGGRLEAGAWQSWNIIVPTSGTYHVSAVASGGGTMAVLVDATTVVAGGASDSPEPGSTYLTAGLHSIMVRAISGAFEAPVVTVSSITEESSTNASFLGVDTSTQGNWKGVYGADGYNIINNRAAYPSYATVTPSNQYSCVWARTTADVRGLQKARPNGTDRLASCWYARSQFSLDVDLTDGQTHKVTLYGLDWDSTARSEQIEVLDALTGEVLDTRTLSSFHDGTYLSWNIRGRVIFRFTKLGGANAVISGIFFD